MFAATTQKQQGLTAAEAAIIAASIAGLVALLTSWLNFVIQRKLLGRQERADAKTARAARITEQLSKLYGPLRLLTTQSHALADKLREGKVDGASWHLLDHLTAVAADPADRAIAEQVIAVNGQVEQLIFAHAGLLKGGEVPDSFVRFLGHYRFLTVAFDAAKNNTTVPREFTAKQFEYYPKDFDSDVKAAYDALRQERETLLAS
jgi:hypothetical protein